MSIINKPLFQVLKPQENVPNHKIRIQSESTKETTTDQKTKLENKENMIEFVKTYNPKLLEDFEILNFINS